jgi:hypothetical protein
MVAHEIMIPDCTTAFTKGIQFEVFSEKSAMSKLAMKGTADVAATK